MAAAKCAALKGRTHGCSDQCCKREEPLANPEPSTHGPLRRFAAMARLHVLGPFSQAEQATCPVGA